MTFPSNRAWGIISRPIQILDEERAELLTTTGAIRGLNESELAGGALEYDAHLTVRRGDMASLPDARLRPYLLIRQLETDALFRVTTVRNSSGPGGGVMQKATLKGLQL